ncbi:P-loop containing nucleoside triphosphate hydrolase protein [Conidiobolus coronatus NRRL 28638]|uniref:p-loop containing nucleoside triphosphate hydrolase protein n=1 Tax=Conidiobolus coronatus (strain ATCC 28846 / CBS 209.66 / NRRL 28638) TaxID=796925 RepID=A0A137NY67_CONC2|nr:P-loop containing nucleoside triphosphate hydrolase protein [Conidiobolus coronatus NRRL 28638]|eukprot:KXN67697.1 P-loop containing nucleoside triphosphate hydrolase protein [Conidiobolus coronatus NRRL 28638]
MANTMKPYKLSGAFFLSDWVYFWVFRLVHQVRNSDLKNINLKLADSESAKSNGDALEEIWKQELENTSRPPSILRALFKIYGTTYSLVGIWKLLWAVFTWLGAYYFLMKSLDFLSDPTNPASTGHLWAVALLLSSLFSSVSIHQLYGQCARISIQVKSSLTVLVYRKSLMLFRIKGGAGEVINILTTDVSRVTDAVTNFHYLWSAFVEATLIIVLSFVLIGYSAFIALGVVLLLLPLQMYLGSLTSKLQVANTEVTTHRVHLMSEILTAIKLIKFYAWEQPFSKKINEIRQKEVELVKKTMKLKAINFAVVFAVPVVVALLCLACYRYTGNVLTSSISFTVLSVFNTLRYPFLMLPLSVKSYAGSKLAFVRLNDFFTRLEVEGLKPLKKDDDPENAIVIENSSFSWEESDEYPTFLNDLSLTIKKGELVAVVGDVGSGKSTLLAALLGQMRQTKGSPTRVYGQISYVPQEAWILNMLLKDNIVFGKEFDQSLYEKTIFVSALTRDLELLVAGDQTEIAERGSNLSGGQRQRVSLARAVYNDGDIVLLDDPLSAVDQNVGRHIFEKCIKEHFHDKTVIFVTHQLQYLPQCDRVIVMKDGVISKMGSYEHLMSTDEQFATLINSHVASGEESDEIEIEHPPEYSQEKSPPAAAVLDQLTVQDRAQLTVRSDVRDINELTVSSLIERNQLSVISNGGRSHDVLSTIQRNEGAIHSMVDEALVNIAKEKNATTPAKSDPEKTEEAPKSGALVEEDKSTTNMGFRDVVLYMAAGSGIAFSAFIGIYFFFVHCIRIASDFWLRLWIPNTIHTSDAVYLGVYAVFVICFTLGVLTRGLFFAYEGAKKAHVLHDDMFRSVMRAPMGFFDTTPIGRILSAFSKHQFCVDDTMPDALMQSLQYAPLALGALVLISAVVYWYNFVYILGWLVICAVFVWYSSPAETKLKQLDAITRPPIYAHLTATLEGLFSIRAYHCQKRFDTLNLDLLDINHQNLYALQTAKTWVAFYLDVVSSFIVYGTALFIVITRPTDSIQSANAFSANAGLALSNALQMLVFLQWTIRMVGDVQAQMSSVGQLVYYGNEIPEEAPEEIPETKPPSSWPPHGVIEFKNIVLRYHKLGVNVLKNVTFTINPKEKIGIVGRTGSGKSTLLISLLRIVEAAEGQILIDGVDISKLGLRDLRTKVAIIPQEPVLFVGTIRSNLDPFNQCTDEQIWKALNSVHLGDKIKAMPSQLDSEVIENGKNFSLGQRQLFCIARAILSNTKILVLDEATAAIDMATDLLIQTAIKENFSEMTVLTIAHRLNTIIESDKVLVMDGGKVMEFDEPIRLLNKPDGVFASLVSQTGEATSAKLREIAQEASDARKAAGKATDGNPLNQVFQNPNEDS